LNSTTPISGPAPFSKSTKFNDLPDDIKKTFENIDSQIQGRIQISNELKQRKMGEEAIKGQELIRELHKELLGVSSVIQSDSLFAKDLKSKTEQAVQDTIVATNIIEGFKNPHQSAAYLKNHASFPLEFFTRVTQEMQERLQWFKNTIEQIERKLSASASQSQNTPQAISSTLQTQHAIFVSLAARTAAVDAEVQKVKTLYTQLWRAKTGSMRDPFNELDRGSGGEFGVESLQVK
jgi:nucleoporin p58/p45